MTVILVAGAEQGAGATTVAVGLARRLAMTGRAVRVERLDGDGRAAADAATFASLEFADSSGAPIAEGAVARDGLTVVEAPAGADAAGIASRLGARLVRVGPVGGDAGSGIYLTNHASSAGALALPEDRLLAAPTVGRLIEASGARVLSRSSEGDAAVCEHIVIGAISHDAADEYFARFPRKAVVTRAEKVDLALAAMLTNAECLILTGGHEPSPYILDRAASTRVTTLLLAPEGTVETLRDIEGTFGSSPFAGETKVERIGELMHLVVDDTALVSLAG